MALDPECTPGWTTGDRPSVTAHCGCGWTVGGFPSKRKALKAQKEHRFPGSNPREATGSTAPARRRPATSAPSPQHTPPSTPSRTPRT